MMPTVILVVAAVVVHTASALSTASNAFNVVQHDAEWQQQIVPGLIKHRISLTYFTFSLNVAHPSFLSLVAVFVVYEQLS